jgi:hypothetical protein
MQFAPAGFCVKPRDLQVEWGLDTSFSKGRRTVLSSRHGWAGSMLFALLLSFVRSHRIVHPDETGRGRL